MSSILIIADLHLSPERPDITECFTRYLKQQSGKHNALYILGDLFEAWVGDDDINEFTDLIAQSIKQFSHSTPTYFIHGNRDFLLGKKYAQKAGMQLLPEQYAIQFYQHSVLLMHGDQLCTDDADYQKFRTKARSWWWQTLMLWLPLSTRQKKAKHYRQQSKLSQQNKSMDIMDVNKSEVSRVMKSTNSDWLIHGHTHRPAIHELGEDKKRIVVGDWYEQGSVLELTEQGINLTTLPLKL